MVFLHVKRGDESQFLFDTSVNEDINKIIEEVTNVYNGRMKVSRICYEMQELINHGTMFPPEMIGLYEDQIQELGLKDEWGDLCVPSGGFTYNKDPIGRRNGKQPNEKMIKVLTQTVEEARAMVSKKLIPFNKCLDMNKVNEAISILRGAVMIAYPMNLPPHDVIRLEFENKEELSGTQASREVIENSRATLWFSGKELQRGKKLKDYVGTNEKTKITVKIHLSGHGAPAREPIYTEDEKKEMMQHAFRRQEELKKLECDEDDNYHNSLWADSKSLQRTFQGLGNISWKPK